MNNFSKITVFIWLLAALVCAACKKHNSFPVEPEISFKGFEKFGADSAHLIISFTDGDGDIGLSQSDTTEPYLFNFFTRYYQKKNGVFTEKILPIPLNYRIPILYSGKKSKSLEGDILITYLKPYYFPTSSSDTIQYEVYIKDRALNTSNSVKTDEIIVP
ncbi:MAG TPA: hypothetical protein PLI68_05080 [Bacteroidia bacterium]|nr:hypothetical protein [Bacteroidia bacterium]HRH06946.1 hypothetical protein [Bacteroidia bacterium]HRH62684.1 hypothetical protein [Bacteroidia bacterium]